MLTRQVEKRQREKEEKIRRRNEIQRWDETGFHGRASVIVRNDLILDNVVKKIKLDSELQQILDVKSEQEETGSDLHAFNDFALAPENPEETTYKMDVNDTKHSLREVIISEESDLLEEHPVSDEAATISSLNVEESDFVPIDEDQLKTEQVEEDMVEHDYPQIVAAMDHGCTSLRTVEECRPLVSSEDSTSSRKSQTQDHGLEVENLHALLAEKDDEVRSISERAAKLEKEITAQKEIVKERSDQLSSQQNLISNLERCLEDQQNALVDKDKQLSNKDLIINNLEVDLRNAKVSLEEMKTGENTILDDSSLEIVQTKELVERKDPQICLNEQCGSALRLEMAKLKKLLEEKDSLLISEREKSNTLQLELNKMKASSGANSTTGMDADEPLILCEIPKHKSKNVKSIKKSRLTIASKEKQNSNSVLVTHSTLQNPRRFTVQLDEETQAIFTSKTGHKTPIVEFRQDNLKKTHHPSGGINPTSSQFNSFRCNGCAKTFSTPEALNTHHTAKVTQTWSTHSIPATLVDNGFRYKPHIGNQKKVYKRDKQYACEQCGRLFAYQSCYEDHVNNHAGIKKYECCICRKRLFSYNELQCHKITQHPDVFPYQCVFCGEKFIGDDDIEKHINCHTDEQWNECGICGANFRNESTKSQSHWKFTKCSCVSSKLIIKVVQH